MTCSPLSLLVGSLKHVFFQFFSHAVTILVSVSRSELCYVTDTGMGCLKKYGFKPFWTVCLPLSFPGYKRQSIYLNCFCQQPYVRTMWHFLENCFLKLCFQKSMNIIKSQINSSSEKSQFILTERTKSKTREQKNWCEVLMRSVQVNTDYIHLQ